MSSLIINTNMQALQSHRSLKNVGTKLHKSSGRLATGLRINSAADDAAGLAISEKMRAQIRGLDMATRNCQDAVSLIQTAEGAMQEINNMVGRIRELVVFASNDTNENNDASTGDRQKIQDEIDQLIMEIDSLATRVEFNRMQIIGGAFADTEAMLKSATGRAVNTGMNLFSTASRAAALGNQLADDTETLANAQVAHDAALEVFTDASETFIGSETDYNRARSNYQSAAQRMFDALMDSETGMTSLADLMERLDPPPDVLAFLSEASAREVREALQGYVANATVLGEDTLGFASLLGGNPVDATLDIFHSTPGIITVDQAQALVDATASTIAPNSTENPGPAPGTQVRLFEAARNIFAREQIVFDNVVQDRNQAQYRVTQTQQDVDGALADFRTANTENSAAQHSQAAAAAARNAGEATLLFFQVGANANQAMLTSIGSLRTDILGIGDGNGTSRIDVVRDSGRDITSIVNVLDTALSYVTTERSKLGAVQNRLGFTSSSLQVSSENLSASESRIRDADMAREMMNVSRANVMQQAGVAMLGQANQAPNMVMQLLQG